MRWLVLLIILFSFTLVSAADNVTVEIIDDIERNYEYEEEGFKWWIIPVVFGGLIILGVGIYFGRDLFKKKRKNLPAFNELLGFVRSAVDEGHTDENIKEVLSSEGWPRKEVGLALDRIHGESKKKLFGFIPTKRITEEEKIESRVKDMMKVKETNKEKLQEYIDDAYDLKKREEKFLELKKEIKEEMPKVLTVDVKKVLRLTDDLLGKMPEDIVEEFVKSPDFKVYKKVMKKVHEPLKEHNHDVERLDKVLSLMEKGVLSKSEARKMLGFSEFRPKKIEKLDKKKLLKKVENTKKYEN
ncbi:hypothetical protein HOD38_01025 [archaeon]|jgi:hypothetical protein|nr:hypothetical protein [archaeon]MBT4396826.1 hypothetical protein [archaeon]MBT4441496.1 hypothetical protein [archaeon]